MDTAQLARGFSAPSVHQHAGSPSEASEKWANTEVENSFWTPLMLARDFSCVSKCSQCMKLKIHFDSVGCVTTIKI